MRRQVAQLFLVCRWLSDAHMPGNSLGNPAKVACMRRHAVDPAVTSASDTDSAYFMVMECLEVQVKVAPCDQTFPSPKAPDRSSLRA